MRKIIHEVDNYSFRPKGKFKLPKKVCEAMGYKLSWAEVVFVLPKQLYCKKRFKRLEGTSEQQCDCS